MGILVLISLLAITSIMSVIQIRLWRTVPNLIFPMFIGVFYYWSLAGAWIFLLDQSVNWGPSIGIHYHYLLEKMFMVHLDWDYLLSLWMIGIFLIFMQFSIGFLIKKVKPQNWTEYACPPKSVNLYAIFALIFLISSFLVVKDVISYSLILNESIYLNIRSPYVSFYSIHQIFNWGLMVSLTLPLSFQLRTRIKSQKPLELGWFYWLLFVLGQFYLVFIGTRHELFICGLFLLIYISYPHPKVFSNWKIITIILCAWVFILGLNDPIRSLAPILGKKIGLTQLLTTSNQIESAKFYQEDRSFLKHGNSQISKKLIALKNEKDTTFILGTDTLVMKVVAFQAQRKSNPEWVNYKGKFYKIPNPHVSTSYQVCSTREKIFKAVSGIIFSNELFAGHFSLYGVLHYQTEPSFGISFKNLMFSFVPSFIRKERPQDAYAYYAQSLNLPSDQGFTINHITAWYLNFGWMGLVIGPIFLCGMILSPWLINKKYWDKFPDITPIILIIFSICFGSILVRTGPEGFKSVIYEAWLIPFGIIGLNQFILKFLSK